MGWAEEDLVPISALQHFTYCPRQWALIHLEQTFEDNLFTLRGHRVHERVERAEREVEEGQRVEYALPLWNDALGLVGKADAVVFRDDGIQPVEHKVGKAKSRLADEVQLCAQALCLEEMFGRNVRTGFMYYHGSRRRREVAMTHELRAITENAAREVRALMRSRTVPAPVADARCSGCSLLDACMPFALQALGVRR